MPWKYTLSSTHATHIDTGEEFGIHYVGATVKSSLDFELVPPAESARAWSQAEIDELREGLWAVMRGEFEQASLRSKLSALIKNPLVGDYYQAADVISRISGKYVSQKTIQAWLADSDKRSSRKCPEWAVEALEDYLAEPENQKRLRDLVNYYKTTASAASVPAMEARTEPSAARPSAGGGERRQEEWRSASMAALPDMVFEMEQRMNAYMSYFNQAINMITTTVLEEDRDLVQIRRSLRDRLGELQAPRFFFYDGDSAPASQDGENQD